VCQPFIINYTIVFWAEELAERRRAHSAFHAGLEVLEHRAGKFLPPGACLVVKHVDAVELRVVVAAVFDAAADAALVPPPKKWFPSS
jgi:hypothetical protein